MWEKYVIFIDGEAIVIDKPAGLAVHPGSKTPESLEDYLKHFRFGFQRAFEAKQVTKTYLAVLAGVPEATEGTVEIALSKVSSAEAGWRMVADPAGRPSVSHWKTLAVKDGRALILFSPETGRTHQLRVHAADGIGVAIAGDPVYGDGRGPMLLHARSIRVERDGKPPVEATAPLPPHFLSAGFDDALL